MTELLQWPVNPAGWSRRWRALGGDWIVDDFGVLLINPSIFPGAGIDSREDEMSLLCRQFNHPRGRQIIRNHLIGSKLHD